MGANEERVWRDLPSRPFPIPTTTATCNYGSICDLRGNQVCDIAPEAEFYSNMDFVCVKLLCRLRAAQLRGLPA